MYCNLYIYTEANFVFLHVEMLLWISTKLTVFFFYILHLNIKILLSLLDPKCFFLYVFTWKIPLSSVQMSKKKLIFIPLQMMWRRDAHAHSSLLSRTMRGDAVMDETGGKAALGRIFDAKTSHYLWHARRRWALIRWSARFTSCAYFKRLVYKSVLMERIKSTQIIFALIGAELKDLTASWSTTTPFERYLDSLLLGTTHTTVVEKKMNILLTFSYLCVTELLSFNIPRVWQRY